MAGVAQLVEHQFVDLVVAGSSPVSRPILKLYQNSCLDVYLIAGVLV